MHVPSPVCPHRATSCSKHRAIAPGCLHQHTTAFLEVACREVIIPRRDRLRGDPDKQQCPAIGDPALPREMSPEPLSPLGDRNRDSVTHAPPSLARPWQEEAQGQALALACPQA